MSKKRSVLYTLKKENYSNEKVVAIINTEKEYELFSITRFKNEEGEVFIELLFETL